LGVGFGLWRLRKPGALLLLIWCGATLAGNSLVHPQVVSTRYVVMMPAIALLMSMGIVYGLKLLLPRRLRLPGTASEMRWRPALAGALVVLAGAVVIGQGVYYYDTHLNQFEDRYRREFLTCGDTDDAVLRSLDLPEGTWLHFISPTECFTGSIINSAHGLHGEPQYIYVMLEDQLTPQYFADLPHDVNHAFFIKRDDESAAPALIQANFPSVEPPQLSPNDAELGPDFDMALYFAPTSAIVALENTGS
ncbi:MAG: hypothetical protein H7175_14160, partial [Burkholderiales bacterium]|nr:hypothetical protein [Anaerolineae bacterium]